MYILLVTSWKLFCTHSYKLNCIYLFKIKSFSFRVLEKHGSCPYLSIPTHVLHQVSDKKHSVTNVTSVLWDTERVLHDHWFVWLPQLNQWRHRSCTTYGWKTRQTHQNVRGIWLYNVGIRQGSSGYFDWSGNWVMQPHSMAKCAVPVPYLRIPRLR